MSEQRKVRIDWFDLNIWWVLYILRDILIKTGAPIKLTPSPMMCNLE